MESVCHARPRSVGFAREMKIKTTIRFGLSDSRFAGKAHATDWVSSELVD